MLYGDECFLRHDGVEIDPKELQPLNIADESCVWRTAFRLDQDRDVVYFEDFQELIHRELPRALKELRYRMPR